MEPTLRGEKLVTLRRYREGAHDFEAGELVRGVFAEGFDVPLIITRNTQKKPFGALTLEEVAEDGFGDLKKALEGMRGYYPGLTEEDVMAIIRFRVNGMPQMRGEKLSWIATRAGMRGRRKR